jgi:valyl-tRNA synthetase
MNSEVDQFGRSANNSDVLSDDKSKRILEALSDIKNQLQNDEFVPKPSNTFTEKTFKEKKDIADDLDFKNLQEKIENLEKKINQIVQNLDNKSFRDINKENTFNDEEKSIFHQFEKNSELEIGRSLTVVNNPYYQKTKISFFQLIFRAVIFIFVCIAIILHAKEIPLSEFIIEIENLI